MQNIIKLWVIKIIKEEEYESYLLKISYEVFNIKPYFYFIGILF